MVQRFKVSLAVLAGLCGFAVLFLLVKPPVIIGQSQLVAEETVYPHTGLRIQTQQTDEQTSQNHTMSSYSNTDQDDIKIGLALFQRRVKAYRTCNQFRPQISSSYMNDNKIDLSRYKNERNIIYNSQYNISFCTVAKMGSTFWKSVFTFLEKRAPNGRKGRKSTSIYNWGVTVANKFPLVVAVRDPWQRLVSVYRQKIETSLFQNGTMRYPLKPEIRYIAGVCRTQPSQIVTFRQMLDACVIKAFSRQRTNIHFLPAYESCNICSMSYDYLIKVENMLEEGAYVLKQAGIDNSTGVMQQVRDSTIRNSEKKRGKPIAEYYKDIPQTMIDQIRQIYKYEIRLFEYPDSPFV